METGKEDWGSGERDMDIGVKDWGREIDRKIGEKVRRLEKEVPYST